MQINILLDIQPEVFVLSDGIGQLLRQCLSVGADFLPIRYLNDVLKTLGNSEVHIQPNISACFQTLNTYLF